MEFEDYEYSKSFLCLLPDEVCGVYAIRNNISDKVYIGSSKTVKARFVGHMKTLLLGEHHSKHLQNFFDKHPYIIFRVELLEKCLPEERKDREQHYLDTLQPFGEKGFNIRKSVYSFLGTERAKITDEDRQNLSNSRSYGFARYDLEGSLLKVYRSRAQLARELNIPKTSINKACNGRLLTYLGSVWKYGDINAPAKIDTSHLNNMQIRLHKSLKGYNEQGELIANYKNAIEYQKATGWDRKRIKRVCARKDNYFKGLHWYCE